MPSVRTCAPPVSRRCTIGAHVCSRYYNKHPPCPRWDTDRVPLGHRPCTTGTPTMYHWDTARVPLGHRPCTTGPPTVSQWAPTVDTTPVRRPCEEPLAPIDGCNPPSWTTGLTNRRNASSRESRFRGSYVTVIVA